MTGSDSHTPAGAGLSMLAIGAGGMDVAMAMAGRPYYFPTPKVLGVKLVEKLPPWVSAKDIILEMLRRYDVKGCVGKVVEYYGPGVASLTVEDRAAIGNMGTELGATSSIFPSDENTRHYLVSQQRGTDWQPLAADEGADYDEYDETDLYINPGSRQVLENATMLGGTLLLMKGRRQDKPIWLSGLHRDGSGTRDRPGEPSYVSQKLPRPFRNKGG